MPAAEGVREADEIIEQATGHPPLKAIAMVVRGCLKGFQGHIEEGRSELRAGRALFFELGDLQHSAGTGMIEADLELAAGNPAAADAVLQESYEFMSKTAETGYLATIVGFRAVAALDLGREDAALALADEVERIASPDDFEPHVRQACVRARVLARRGDHDAAAESIQAAAAVGDKTDYLSLREYVAISRAEVERLAGRPDGERAALDEALRLAEAKDDVLTTGRVRELLGRLNEPVSP
jgi:tetratricopeptide (TPR) repeat protein